MATENDPSSKYAKVEFLSIMKVNTKIMLLIFLTVCLYQAMALIPILNQPLNLLLALILSLAFFSTVSRQGYMFFLYLFLRWGGKI